MAGYSDPDLGWPAAGGGLLGGDSSGGGGGWLGNLFNFSGGRSTTADLYGDLFTKKQLAAIQQRESQAKMAGLLNVFSQAAAPSKFKKDWGQILGQAGGAMLGATGGDTAAQGALTGTLTAQKIKQLQAELAAQEAARKINQTIYGRLFGGGAPAGAAAPAPPVPAGVVSQPGPAPGPDVAPSPVAPPRPVGSYGGPGGGQQPLPFPTFGGGAPAPPGGPPMQPASFAPQGQPDQMLAGLLGGAAQPPFSQEEANPMGGILGGPGLPPPDEVLASDRPPFAGGMPPVQQTAGLTGSQWEIANHNYGGMRKPGVNASPSQGGFQSFPNAEAGLQAISRQLDRYASGATTGKPLTTIRGIVSTWAPPSENPTATLVARAAKIMGVDPDQPLDLSDPLTKAKLITATIANEQGGRVPVDPELIAQVASAPPGSVSGLDEVVGQRRGVPGFTRAQYAPSGGAPAASGGVSDIIPGLGVSPAELALVDSINEQAKLGTPFKAFLDAYYKTPGYLGQAAGAESRARKDVDLQMDPLIREQTERAALRAQLALKPELDAAIEEAKNGPLEKREAAKAKIDRITKQMEQTGAAALEPAVIRVPDGRGGQIEVQGTRAQAARAAHGLAVPELGIPARRSGDAPDAAITPPTGTPVLTEPEKKLGGSIAEEIIEMRKTARFAAPTIRNTHDLRAKLDSGMFTGLDADWNLFGAKLGDALGVTGKTTQEKIANTEVYISKLGEETANLIKSMKLGPPTSDADVKFAERIAGRQSLSAAAIRELLDMRERYARLAIEQYNEEAKGYRPEAFGGGRQFIPMPEPYVQKQGTSPGGHGWRER